MSNGDHVFLDEAWLLKQAEGFLANVREAGMFARRDQAGVVQGLAATLQGVNMIHPFREGNGRSQRILTSHIAARAGYLVDWERMGSAVQNEVMARSFAGELAPLREALGRVIVPMVRGGALEESPWPSTPDVAVRRAGDIWKFTKPGAQVLAESRTKTATPGAGRPLPQRGLGQEPGPELGR
jgi:cell filamentation protein